ncbi:MAG: hypothetical protein K1000chlam2_00316 [Chlamydiae bacterium]|nr:hypothetical protein [Chlamydiota bacterium]
MSRSYSVSLMFTIFLIFCTSTLRSEQPNEITTYLISSESSCITRITESKVYINPDKIFPTNEGLFLELEQNEFVALPYLLADNEGCFVEKSRVIKVTKPCPFCGCERISNALRCPNRNCSSNEKKKSD